MATDCYSCKKPGHWSQDCPNRRRSSHGSATPPSNQALAQRKSKAICYFCQEIGHWSSECPNKTLKRPQRDSKNDLYVPVIECSHGHGPCSVHTSASDKNPNRKYYQCSRRVGVSGFCGAERCDFFQWCDEVKLPEGVPMCPCGAGRCSVRREKKGPDKGRWSFSCRVQKGQGACSFSQWVDANKHDASPQLGEHNTEAIASHLLWPSADDKPVPLTPEEHVNQLKAVVTACGGSCSDAIDAVNIDWDSESDVDKTPQASRPSVAQICAWSFLRQGSLQ